MPYRNLLYFGPNTIMYCLLLTSIMMSATTNSFGQFSGSGEIVNYNTSSSGCGDPDCNQHTNPEDYHQFIVPWDGSVTYTATLSQEDILCCGSVWTYNHTVHLVNHNGGRSVGSRYTGPGTFTETVDCLHAGDTIQLRFFGTGGVYNFNLDFTADVVCEQEPNNSKATALIIPDLEEPQSGCLAYVESHGSDVDNEDYYALGGFNYGDSIQIRCDVTNRMRFMITRENSSNILADWTVQAGNPETEIFVFPADDDYFLKISYADLTPCVQYEFDIDLLGSFPCDTEQNDSKATAISPDDLGNTITGCLSFKGEDYMDYISSGHYLVGDTIDAWIHVSSPIRFAFYRENDASELAEMVVLAGPTLFRHIVTVEDDYYLKPYINPSVNTPIKYYWIDLDACPTNMVIQNSFLSGHRSAAESLTLINCVIEDDLTLNAPEVQLSPEIEVPNSKTVVINSSGCSN